MPSDQKQQPGSGYWGTGPDLSTIRGTMDSKLAGQMFEALSRRMHGMAFGYELLEFRSLYHTVVLIDNRTGQSFEIEALEHLLSEDGRGY